jgi:hypothetical protein
MGRTATKAPKKKAKKKATRKAPAKKKRAKKKAPAKKRKPPAGDPPAPPAPAESPAIERAKKRRHLFLLEKVAAGRNLAPYELAELKKFERGETPAGHFETQKELAEAFEVSTRTVKNWVSRGCPRGKDGLFSFEAVAAWLETWKPDEDGKSAESEFRHWRAKLAELKYLEAAGDLIPRDEVERGRVQRVLAVKERLLGLPGTLAPLLAGQDARAIQGILTDKIREAIEAFAAGRNGQGKK